MLDSMKNNRTKFTKEVFYKKHNKKMEFISICYFIN